MKRNTRIKNNPSEQSKETMNREVTTAAGRATRESDQAVPRRTNQSTKKTKEQQDRNVGTQQRPVLSPTKGQ